MDQPCAAPRVCPGRKWENAYIVPPTMNNSNVSMPIIASTCATMPQSSCATAYDAALVVCEAYSGCATIDMKRISDRYCSVLRIRPFMTY